MKPKEKSPPEQEFYYMQDTAFEIIQQDAVPRKCFASALIAYQALCSVGGETNSEVGPGRDGTPFQTTLARIAFMTYQPVALTLARFKDFIRLGLVDPVQIPPDPKTPMTMRLRTVNVESDGGGR